MFSQIRKITKKIFKTKENKSNFSFCFACEKQQIHFFNEIFIEKMDFKLVLLENENYEIINLNFKYTKSQNRHFLPFEVTHKFLKIQGSIIITFKADQIIIEKRINANRKIKTAIKTKIILANQVIKNLEPDQVLTNFQSYQVNYFSSYQNWILQNKNEIIDLLEIQDTRKAQKNWKTTNNNINYHTIKIKIGLKNDKI
ncbi:hypothetical protein [Mesomycoplasma hyopneumoniae]|uniref:hypothetical protein n=1 Tax=Mesomycoplasma hyopneumoniae TaxID=2099 RepID=UPI0038784220